MEVVLIVCTSLIGIFGVSAALEGYILSHMNWAQRILSAVGGLMLIDPEIITDIVGIALVAVTIVWQSIQRKREQHNPLL